MLIQYSVGNFLSFNQEVHLNLIPAKKNKLHQDHILKNEGKGANIKALPLAIFYGANASGKSNLVQSLYFARELIVKGTHGNQDIDVIPFLLSTDGKNQPSNFEFIFTHQNVLYTYGFKTTDKEIKEEWLFAVFSKKENRLFERITKNGKVYVEVGNKLADSKNEKQRLKFVAEGTRPNQLFLTESFERNVERLKPVMDWFGQCLVIISPNAEFNKIILHLQRDKNFKTFFNKFLHLADTGIDNIHFNEKKIDLVKDLSNIKENTLKSIIEDLEKDPDHHIEFGKTHQFLAIQKENDGATKLIEMGTQHKRSDGTIINFDTRYESDGTHRIMHLSPALYDLQSEEKVYVIDELDRSLHPLLSKLFIESFLNFIKTNKSHGQMILTTHETCLLDLDMLRRDEIWFIEKDKNNSSQISSLIDFNIRADLKISKGYINGRFGAIPFLGNFDQLFPH